MPTRGASPISDLVAHHAAGVQGLARELGRAPGRKVIQRRLGCSRADAEALAAWWREELDADEPTEEVAARTDGWKVEADEDDDGLHVSVRGQALVMCVEDLVRVANIDVSKWRVAKHRVNTWTTSMRGDDGEPRIVRNWQVRADFERRLAQAVQPIQPVQPLPRHPNPETRPTTCTLMVPDSQHGFRWSADRKTLEPLHDRRACNLIVQLAHRLQPDRIVLLGDMLDLAEWSTRYPRPAELRDTTQPTLTEVHAWIASLRVACLAAEIIYLEGNHEHRIQRQLVESSSPAAGLVAVGDNRPALDLARLLGLDALDVEYIGPYGESYYLHERIRLTHGDKVRSGGGATAKAVIAEAVHSTWYGHVHRVEIAHRTLHGPRGPQVIHAASPGCLCRIDGSVPGVSARPDWQQGVGIVWHDADHDYAEVRLIQDGRLAWGGIVLVGDEGPVIG